MNESEWLTDLREGAKTCLVNAKRLLEDAQLLFGRRSYLSCFLLSQLSLEELAKGFALIEKHLKGEVFSKQEWRVLTKNRWAHVRKLKYLQEVEDKWTEECVGKKSISYIETLHQIVSKVSWANNLGEYREKISKVHYQWRINSLYVGYDFEKKDWIEPSTHPIFDGVTIGFLNCRMNIIRANYLSQALMAKLEMEGSERE